MAATFVFSLVLLFVFASMVYVYQYRGSARYASVNEYLRKGWPVFTPMNVLLYLFSQRRARKPIADLSDFKELNYLQENWQTIQEEAIALYNKGLLEQTNKPDSQAYYDLGFRTFFKYGWSKFYLTWYGHTHNSAKELCPKTVEIVKKVPSVNGAMFSILPPGSQLTRHLDPIACSLRYHLGLMTPNDDDCFINIDDQKYSWRDGDALLFDETYIHYAKNNTDKARLILMCDINRPTNFIGKIINFIYKGFARLSVVPNMEGDKRGLINSIFSTLSPLFQKSKALKETNRSLYRIIKYSVNTLLFFISLAILAGLIQLASYILFGASAF